MRDFKLLWLHNKIFRLILVKNEILAITLYPDIICGEKLKKVQLYLIWNHGKISGESDNVSTSRLTSLRRLGHSRPSFYKSTKRIVILFIAAYKNYLMEKEIYNIFSSNDVIILSEKIQYQGEIKLHKQNINLSFQFANLSSAFA